MGRSSLAAIVLRSLAGHPMLGYLLLSISESWFVPKEQLLLLIELADLLN